MLLGCENPPTDPFICTEAFCSATLCIMMFHSLSNCVTIWNILQKCRWAVYDNFQSPSKCTTIYKICRRSLLRAPLDTVSICLMDWLSYSHSAVLLPRYTRLSTPDCFLRFFSLLVRWLFLSSRKYNLKSTVKETSFPKLTTEFSKTEQQVPSLVSFNSISFLLFKGFWNGFLLETNNYSYLTHHFSMHFPVTEMEQKLSPFFCFLFQTSNTISSVRSSQDWCQPTEPNSDNSYL